MITPETFYSGDDYPGSHRKKEMWNAVNKRTEPHEARMFDTKSFAYGIAASIVLYFASVGAYTTAKQAMVKSQPAEVRLDNAYQSAVQELEMVVPQAVTQLRGTETMRQYVDLRTAQLKEIDSAIVDLRSEISTGDLSAMKQERLRHLYSMKLRVLQAMIEKGEIKL